MTINLSVGNDIVRLHANKSNSDHASLNAGVIIKELERNYNELVNKPSINNVELVGNKTSADLGLNIIHTDTTANWNAQRDFVSEYGHVYVYSDYQIINDVPVPGLKVGDGSSYLIDMPFTGAAESEQLVNHMNDETMHITDEERDFWNNKVTCFISNGDNENVVFTKDNV